MAAAHLFVLLSIIFHFSCVYSQVASPSWIPEKIPNPWSDPSQCGLQFQSWICDPDGLINKREYGKIQDALADLYSSSGPVVDCSDGSKQGLKLGVLAVDNIDRNEVCKEMTGENWEIKCMEKFTRSVAQSWAVGSAGCHNGAVIGLSRSLRSCYIVTAAGAKKVLPDHVAASIVQDEMIPYLRHNHFAAGVLAGVRGIKSRIAPPSALDTLATAAAYFFFAVILCCTLASLMGPVFWHYLIKVVYFALLPFAYLIDLIRWPYTKYKQRHAERHFEAMRRTVLPEVPNAAAESATTTSDRENLPEGLSRRKESVDISVEFLCPICLETTIDIPTKSLICRHRFHTECIDCWLEPGTQGRSCPICRCDASAAGPQPPTPPPDAENWYREYLKFLVSRFEQRHGLGAAALGNSQILFNNLRRSSAAAGVSCSTGVGFEPMNRSLFLLSSAIRHASISRVVPSFTSGSVPRSSYSRLSGGSRSSAGFSRSSGGGGGGGRW